MTLQNRQVVEGIDLGSKACLNQAHQAIAHFGPILGLVEQAVLPVHDGTLDEALSIVVIHGGSGNLEKPGHSLPMVDHVFESVAQRAVGLDFLAFELLLVHLS